jgi:hypothetical protein
VSGEIAVPVDELVLQPAPEIRRLLVVGSVLFEARHRAVVCRRRTARRAPAHQRLHDARGVGLIPRRRREHGLGHESGAVGEEIRQPSLAPTRSSLRFDGDPARLLIDAPREVAIDGDLPIDGWRDGKHRQHHQQYDPRRFHALRVEECLTTNTRTPRWFLYESSLADQLVGFERVDECFGQSFGGRYELSIKRVVNRESRPLLLPRDVASRVHGASSNVTNAMEVVHQTSQLFAKTGIEESTLADQAMRSHEQPLMAAHEDHRVVVVVERRMETSQQRA